MNLKNNAKANKPAIRRIIVIEIHLPRDAKQDALRENKTALLAESGDQTMFAVEIVFPREKAKTENPFKTKECIFKMIRW